jgi:D-sedoheptulose 7-phosphate isomerase
MMEEFLKETIRVLSGLNLNNIQEVVRLLVSIKGRVFFIGSGGGAGHASHAAADFNKLCGIESYAPYDNVSLLTALTNDEGYHVSLERMLQMYNLDGDDCVFVISVGGGQQGVSDNIVHALGYAKDKGAKIIGIVGKDGGWTKIMGDACILIPESIYLTAITEGVQAVLWHMIVTILSKHKPKW